MNLHYSNIHSILEKEAVEKTVLRLEKEGFSIERNYKFHNLCFDLFAYKNSEKRLYEFKITKNKMVQSPSSAKKYEILQRAAKVIGARLIFIYINPPYEGTSVSFEELEDILFEDLNKKKDKIEFFNRLLSPTIQMVFDLNIEFLSIKKEALFITGSSMMDIETLTVDESVFNSNPNLKYLDNNNYILKFEITLNKDLKIIESKYAFPVFDSK